MKIAKNEKMKNDQNEGTDSHGFGTLKVIAVTRDPARIIEDIEFLPGKFEIAKTFVRIES